MRHENREVAEPRAARDGHVIRRDGNIELYAGRTGLLFVVKVAVGMVVLSGLVGSQYGNFGIMYIAIGLAILVITVEMIRSSRPSRPTVVLTALGMEYSDDFGVCSTVLWSEVDSIERTTGRSPGHMAVRLVDWHEWAMARPFWPRWRGRVSGFFCRMVFGFWTPMYIHWYKLPVGPRGFASLVREVAPEVEVIV